MNAFRIVTILVGLIPIFFGISGLLGGASGVVPEPQLYELPEINALDSQYRYLAGTYLGIGLMIIYSALGPPAEMRAKRHLFRFAMMAWFLGGLGRTISWMMVGEPAGWQVSGMAIELLAPLLIIWQMRVLKP